MQRHRRRPNLPTLRPDTFDIRTDSQSGWQKLSLERLPTRHPAKASDYSAETGIPLGLFLAAAQPEPGGWII